MTKYELDSLVDILNKKLYNSYTKLLASNGFDVYRTEDGTFKCEDFLTPDESHCITHFMVFNKKDKLILEHWEVTY